MARAWDWTLGQNRIVPQAAGDEPGGGTTTRVNDQFWERLVKGVPVEAVGVYTAMVPFGRVPEGAARFVTLFILFALGLAATFLAMTMLRKVRWRDADPVVRRIARIQIFLAILAFAVWAYAQGGFFAEWRINATTTVYQDFVAGILAIVMGFVLILSDQIPGMRPQEA